MREIAQIPWNGLSVVSTFSGAGGSCLGYRMAGYRVLWANEFIPEAQLTYKANHPTSYLDTRDIRQVSQREILDRTGLRAGELALFEGSPPCQAFSKCGVKDKGWNKVKQYSDSEQRTDDLFYEYIRILKGLQPKCFVAENVAGLVMGTSKGYFLEILSALKSSGYRVKAAVLNAKWLGVPQARERLFFVGVRNDLNLEPVFPSPIPYRYNLEDVLPDVRRIIQRKVFKEGLRVTRANEVCPTITASGVGGKIRDWCFIETSKGERHLTIDELKLLASFPEDFVLTGTYAQQWERIGRSVPPLAMCAISSAIRDRILQPATL